MAQKMTDCVGVYDDVMAEYTAIKGSFDRLVGETSLEFLSEYFNLFFVLTRTPDQATKADTIEKISLLKEKYDYQSTALNEFEAVLCQRINAHCDSAASGRYASHC